MIPKYLFIDDETGSVTKALLDGFNDKKLVNISPLTLSKDEPFEKVCNRIKEEFAAHQYDGVLIDLCLDGTGANSLAFKAQPFTQQIRTWASEGKMPQFPVVLCSTIGNYDVYRKDSASHDLFDYYFDKTDVNYEHESICMKSLAEGYQLLNKKDIKVEEYLGRKDIYEIDDQVIDYLRGPSTFDIARRIVKDVMPYPGILIDQHTVTARMGINMKDSDGWPKLKGAIYAQAEYRGVFAAGWKRCWSDKVNAFFMSLSEGKPYQILSAEERVAILEKAGFEGLVPAKPIELNNSSYYNTVCSYSGLPLDSMEGIPVEDRMSLMPWQENHYVSFYFVAKGDFKEERLCQEGLKKKQEIIQRLQDEQAKGE